MGLSPWIDAVPVGRHLAIAAGGVQAQHRIRRASLLVVAFD
jgi:hypothetical protein